MQRSEQQIGSWLLAALLLTSSLQRIQASSDLPRRAVQSGIFQSEALSASGLSGVRQLLMRKPAATVNREAGGLPRRRYFLFGALTALGGAGYGIRTLFQTAPEQPVPPVLEVSIAERPGELPFDRVRRLLQEALAVEKNFEIVNQIVLPATFRITLPQIHAGIHYLLQIVNDRQKEINFMDPRFGAWFVVDLNGAEPTFLVNVEEINKLVVEHRDAILHESVHLAPDRTQRLSNPENVRLLTLLLQGMKPYMDWAGIAKSREESRQRTSKGRIQEELSDRQALGEGFWNIDAFRRSSALGKIALLVIQHMVTRELEAYYVQAAYLYLKLGGENALTTIGNRLLPYTGGADVSEWVEKLISGQLDRCPQDAVADLNRYLLLRDFKMGEITPGFIRVIVHLAVLPHPILRRLAEALARVHLKSDFDLTREMPYPDKRKAFYNWAARTFFPHYYPKDAAYRNPSRTGA